MLHNSEIGSRFYHMQNGRRRHNDRSAVTDLDSNLFAFVV